MLSNFKNCIEGINVKEKGFICLKQEFLTSGDLTLVADILSLSCLNNTHRTKMLIELLKDGSINDFIVQKLCEYLEDISPVTWDEMKLTISDCICGINNRSWQLSLIQTLEILYAKNLPGTRPLLFELYRRIEPRDNDFSPNSEENIRIKCARIAYHVNQYNFVQRLGEINKLKNALKRSGNKQLMGMVFYYKALCVQNIECYGKDTSYYMRKSLDKGYRMAGVYLDYHYNVETSSK
ncbi:MAG: hypothetical protein PUE13_08915 [Clostridiales bacterium]|nr:hypothetical protein [Clostridiales bacterium]